MKINNKKYSDCWLPNIEDNLWNKKVIKSNIFKNIYIPNNYSFIKKEIIFFIKKENINFNKHIKNSTLIFKINIDMNNEEYYIKKNNKLIWIISKNKNGFLYGLYHIFRIIKLNKYKKKNFIIKEIPSLKIRMINHKDFLSGKIEKGHSGNSIFFFNNNINFNIERIRYYSRLLCSIGINYICINNSDNNLLSTYLINKNLLIQLIEIYNIFYEYNIKIFISINYKSPMILGRLNTFDPLNKKVIIWWEKKIEQIYEYLPNLAGLIVSPCYKNKNNNLYYDRNHIESSNTIANALNFFNGILIWECNINNNYNWKIKNFDKANCIFNNFNNLDGLFLNNVFLKIKFGPIDFQVREPVSPILGSMYKTSQILEFQMNQEYTGQQIDLCWLPLKWKNILYFNTYYKNKNSTIKNLILGNIYKNNNYGISCVSNIGDSFYWTNHFLSQSNIFCYGKIIWNLNINLNNLLKEWIKLSINNNKKVIKNISKIMFNSWITYEKYTSPLGLGGMVEPNNNYIPNVDGYEYNNFGIYHNANRYSVGNNRTSNGTKFTEQYSIRNKIKFNDINKCYEKLLLFFHNVSYKHKLKKSKVTLIQYIYNSHFNGKKEVKEWLYLWKKIKFLINKKVYNDVYKKLILQYKNSCRWCDIVNSYFYRKSGIKDILNRKIYS